jgi:thiol-disulfide isomerase/thioredoxin
VVFLERKPQQGLLLRSIPIAKLLQGKKCGGDGLRYPIIEADACPTQIDRPSRHRLRPAGWLPANSGRYGAGGGTRARRHLLARAAKEKKRVLLDFGGNWCGDCQVLQIYFHDPANWNLLQQNYVLVPVNIGRYDENLDIAARYGVPVDKGVPALAVLDANGQLVYSQRNREFEAMRKVDPAAVTQFLLQWKG